MDKLYVVFPAIIGLFIIGRLALIVTVMIIAGFKVLKHPQAMSYQ
jgi:hypothetical protein